MSDKHATPIFFAPFVSSTMRIEPAWIDYNGHLNVACYHVLFDRAVDEGFGAIGLGPDYVQERNASFFTAETHTVHRRELSLGDTVRVTLQLIDFDEKRLHYYLEMRHAVDSWTAATAEHLALHIDMKSRQTAAFPDEILANLAVMRAAHERLPHPVALSRVIGMRRPAGAEPELATSTRH